MARRQRRGRNHFRPPESGMGDQVVQQLNHDLVRDRPTIRRVWVDDEQTIADIEARIAQAATGSDEFNNLSDERARLLVSVQRTDLSHAGDK